ncbi:MAG TPA: peptidoglycan-binding protein [Chthoniobacterales bacterium]|jgi:hypothetical protein|nr:peptidoglycan-binding protein [Chthoniobacterales bacterium]
MLKFIAILTASCVALTVSLQAKPADAGKKPAEKSKAAAKPDAAPKQHAAPKHQPAAPKTHVPAAPKTERAPKAPKKQARTAPAPESATEPIAKSKKDKPDKADLKNSTAATINPKKGPPSKEAVQKIQAQHRNFQAKPSTTITSAQFNPNYRIAAAQSWTGPQYEIFRSYQPQWHDQAWYGSRYGTNLRLIGGGWYFWEAGYWFPAWGYDESAAYYPYDGPIYVGADPRPFDQVVADVQAILQEQGFYRGEIDGLVGPLTREALAAYQSANGLYTTQAIDRPTLESLGLAG